MALSDDLLLHIRLGRHEDTVIFINSYVDVEVLRENTPVILSNAVYYGSERVLEALVNKGLNIHYINNDGMTALHLAAQNGHLHLMRFLIEKYEIAIDECYLNGDTILHFAIKNGLSSVVKWLLSKGANLHIVNEERMSAMDLAHSLGNEDILEIIVNHLTEQVVEVEYNSQVNATTEGNIMQFPYIEGLNIIGGCDDVSI